MPCESSLLYSGMLTSPCLCIRLPHPIMDYTLEYWMAQGSQIVQKTKTTHVKSEWGLGRGEAGGVEARREGSRRGEASCHDPSPHFIFTCSSFRILDYLGAWNRLNSCPAGFWPLGQNPRRHPRIPRVYTYKEFQNVRK